MVTELPAALIGMSASDAGRAAAAPGAGSPAAVVADEPVDCPQAMTDARRNAGSASLVAITRKLWCTDAVVNSILIAGKRRATMPRCGTPQVSGNAGGSRRREEQNEG